MHRLFPVFLLDLIDPPERNPESGGKITRLTTGTQLIHPVCLLCFIKVPFPDSGKINVCFYCENEKLLEALKHAGLDKEK